MPYFPLFVDLFEKPVVVVGGGQVASRKVEKLLEYGAKITVIAPAIGAGLRTLPDALPAAGNLVFEERPYRGVSDLANAALVISAANDKEVNASVAKDARASGIPVNVVDNKELSDFYFPALVRRDNLVVGIGTSGEAPAQSAALRKKIDAILDDLLEEKS
jgi:siroheme synthase-like protein